MAVIGSIGYALFWTGLLGIAYWEYIEKPLVYLIIGLGLFGILYEQSINFLKAKKAVQEKGFKTAINDFAEHINQKTKDAFIKMKFSQVVGGAFLFSVALFSTSIIFLIKLDLLPQNDTDKTIIMAIIFLIYFIVGMCLINYIVKKLKLNKKQLD